MATRVAVAGYGIAGAVFHAPLIEAVEGLEVSAVMTSSPERAEKARARHRDVTVVETVEQLLDGAHVLVVASPNASHSEIALAGLERGLHVVVDKPLAVTAADARRVAETAPERVTVFHNRRWDGDFLTVRWLVEGGRLGAITRFESRFERYRPQLKEGWRESDPAAGGGVLLDLGSHLVDQAIQLFGPPEHVHAEVRNRRPGAQVEDDVFIALEHAGGEISHLWMSAVAPLHGPRFRLSGLDGGFACDGLDPQEDQLRGGLHPGDPGFGEASAPGRLEPSGEELALERGRYELFYEGVRKWVAGGAPAPVDPLDGVRVIEILETVRKAP
jgi:predicted dehydrogenase